MPTEEENDEEKAIIHDMVTESVEQLDDIGADILDLEHQLNKASVDKIFRAFHSIKGNISMIGFPKCGAFAHKAEDVISLLRDGKLTPDKTIIDVLLKSVDVLHDLLEDIKREGRDDRDVSDVYRMLEKIESTIPTEPVNEPDIEETVTGINSNVKKSPKETLNILVAEDNLHARLLMQEILSPLGNVFSVVNGEEAVVAFLDSLRRGDPYDLICLDIMMPIKDGQTVLKEIRETEKDRGILPGKGVTIVMTTALTDPKNVMKTYDEMCNAYIFKPINIAEFMKQLQNLGLI